MKLEEHTLGAAMAAIETLQDLGFTFDNSINRRWSPPKNLPPHMRPIPLEEQFRQVMMALGFPSAQHLSSGDVLTVAVAGMKVFQEADPRNPRTGPFAKDLERRSADQVALNAATPLNTLPAAEKEARKHDQTKVGLEAEKELVRQVIREELKISLDRRLNYDSWDWVVSLYLVNDEAFDSDAVREVR